MPVGDVLVGDTGSYIKHDDATLPVDVVSITKATELLLTSGIPDIELNLTQVLYHQVSIQTRLRVIVVAYRRETERVDFYTEGGNVFLLKLAGDVTLDEGGLERAVSSHDTNMMTCAISPCLYHHHQQEQA
jgi:hypothetical protein